MVWAAWPRVDATTHSVLLDDLDPFLQRAMETTKGIITVVDQSLEQEDEVLVALRELPKFEPLIVPEQPTHFSLASVFGSLSTSAESSRHGSSSTEMAFSPNVLVDILVQINAHNKKCAQDIQDYQRALAQKMRALDDYTTGAVQELVGSHHQAKNHSDHLLSVHAIAKQAQTTTTLLHGIVSKLAYISEFLPSEPGSGPGPSPEKYPNLHRYLHQAPSHSHSAGQGWASISASTSATNLGSSGDVSNSASKPSGLALLGHSPSSKLRKQTTTTSTSTSSSSISSAVQQQYLPTRTAALSVPKARASMALASSSLGYLPIHAGVGLEQGEHVYASRSFEGSSSSASSSPPRYVPRSRPGSSFQDQPGGGAGKEHRQPATILRASDNLRRLASKGGAPHPSSTPPPQDHHPLL